MAPGLSRISPCPTDAREPPHSSDSVLFQIVQDFGSGASRGARASPAELATEFRIEDRSWRDVSAIAASEVGLPRRPDDQVQEAASSSMLPALSDPAFEDPVREHEKKPRRTRSQYGVSSSPLPASGPPQMIAPDSAAAVCAPWKSQGDIAPIPAAASFSRKLRAFFSAGPNCARTASTAANRFQPPFAAAADSSGISTLGPRPPANASNAHPLRHDKRKKQNVSAAQSSLHFHYMRTSTAS